MPIEDGILARLQREAGDAAPVNTVNDSEFANASTGVVSGVDQGGELAWRFQGPGIFEAVTPVHNWNNDGDGHTMAIRCIVGNNGTYDVLAAAGDGNKLTSYSGGGSRARIGGYGSTVTGAAVASAVKTVVIRSNIQPSAIGTDSIDVWRSDGGVTDDPDASSSGFNIVGGSYSFDEIIVGNDTVADYDITILDLVVWDRTLSDAEARAVASDIRAELPAGGGAPPPVDPVITLEPLKNNAGTVLGDETGIKAHIYNPANGNKVVTLTGQSSDATGIVSLSDASLTAAQEYYVLIELSDGAYGLTKAVAAAAP